MPRASAFLTAPRALGTRGRSGLPGNFQRHHAPIRLSGMPTPVASARLREAPSPLAVPAPVTLPDEIADAAPDLAKRYYLVLLDDDDHSYAYVIEMLGRLFGYGREKSLAIAAMVDTHGRAIVETAGYDRVNRDQRRVHGYGPDPRIERCAGSMSALVEEAD